METVTFLALHLLQMHLHVWWWIIDLNYGSVPDWLAGIGTVVASCIALFALLASRRTNRNQQKQIDALEDEKNERQASERRKQAELIACWGDPHTEEFPLYRVSNRSGQPVYDFIVWHFGPEIGRSRVVAVLPPGEFVLAASRQDPTAEAFEKAMGMPVEYAFRDIRQIKWHRNAAGDLRIVDNYPVVGIPAASVLTPIESPNS